MFLNDVVLLSLKLRQGIAVRKNTFFSTELCVFIMKAHKCRYTLKSGIEKVFTENLFSKLCITIQK